MTEEFQMIFDEFKSSNEKSISFLESELLKIRAGRATPNMLNGVMVEYYGTMTPLSQVANVGTLDARTITIKPWEKSILNDVMKGIINANLGFAPQNNGESLIINVPILTEERRKELVKRVKAEGENTKIVIRNNRKDALDMIKGLKDEEGFSEDDIKDAEEEIQQITNSTTKKIDEIIDLKDKEIMTV